MAAQWGGRAVIRKRLREVESDERLRYPPARVDINAPLALVQVDLKAERRALRFALDALA